MSNLILADIFLSEEAQKILRNKFVLLIGDSDLHKICRNIVIRSMYKDLVKFLNSNEHLTDQQLKIKGELYFENDTLLEGGQKGVMSNDLSYTEVREFKTSYHLVRFYFITRCYSDYLKSICEDIKNESIKPDVVIMNSGCWDITRYGMNSLYEYKQNLPIGIYHLMKVLPSYTDFIWTTILPLSKDVKGGFMVPEAENMKSRLREDVLEANYFAVNVIDELRLDVLDLHYYFHNQTHRRAKDGIHWDATAHRRITNLILHHLCEAWRLESPGRLLMKQEIDTFDKYVENTQSQTEEEGEVNENSESSNSNLNYNNNHSNGQSQNRKNSTHSLSNKEPLPIELMHRINEIKKSDMSSNLSHFNTNQTFTNMNNNNNNTNNLNNQRNIGFAAPSNIGLLNTPNEINILQSIYQAQQQQQQQQQLQAQLFLSQLNPQLSLIGNANGLIGNPFNPLALQQLNAQLLPSIMQMSNNNFNPQNNNNKAKKRKHSPNR